MSHIDELQALIDKWRAEKKRKCENCKHWDNWVFRLTTIKYRNPRWVNYSFGVCNSQDGYYGYGVLLDKNSDAENCKDFTPRGDVNMDFESEVRKLLAKMKPEEKPEEKPFIEPCPICGGEMEKGRVGNPTHVGERMIKANAELITALRNNLHALLDAVEALENLMAEQNGPPLSLPRHADKWKSAMYEAEKALAKLEADDET